MNVTINCDEVLRDQGSPCRHCGSTSHVTLIKNDLWHGIHHGKKFCDNCERFLAWMPKPSDQRAKGKRSAGQSRLVKRYSPGYCQICLRLSDSLPRTEHLEAHHIIEVQNGGSDNPDNIMIVCTPCHRWIHHERTYKGHGYTQFTGNELA